jgi:ubiquinone/menaquinone biosynthesis C-methylase UbiE
MLDPSIAEHYQSGYERSRLFPGGHPKLEFVRSLELLGRLLPAPPARVLDVGGGPGTYAVPLAEGGYQVHLVDPLPLHVRQAEEAAQRRSAPGSYGPGSYGPGSYGPGGTAEDGPAPDSVASSFTASVGDARRLGQPDESQDAVVLFGPLYHLTSADERGQALAEAHRVLRPGGRLMAMAISRCASLLDGLYRDWLDDPVFRPIVDRDLADGQHRNPDPAGRPEFFTTAYFHSAEGLAEEVRQSGFDEVEVYGVEGPGWPLDREWADSRRHEQILFAARAVETDPSVIGFSHHFIAAASRP